MGKKQLQQKEHDADEQAQRRTAILMQSQPVTEIEKTTDERLGYVIGQAHLSIRHKQLLNLSVVYPIKQQEAADPNQHESQIVPRIPNRLHRRFQKRILDLRV